MSFTSTVEQTGGTTERQISTKPQACDEHRRQNTWFAGSPAPGGNRSLKVQGRLALRTNQRQRDMGGTTPPIIATPKHTVLEGQTANSHLDSTLELESAGPRFVVIMAPDRIRLYPTGCIDRPAKPRDPLL